MLSRLMSKVTYANVVASLALFLALGGISYAAAMLPKNSVGSKQIKDNAVTGTEIKDGSIKLGDLAAGIRPSAPATNGANGEKGAPGAPGEKGQDADRGLLDPASDLPGLGVVELSIDGSKLGVAKAYRIDCSTASLCTVKIGGAKSKSIEFDAWFELAMAGDPNVARSFSVTQLTSEGGTPLARYHVTKGRPSVMRTQNDRFEMTFTAEFIQRVSV